jgi:hypothetical protein
MGGTTRLKKGQFFGTFVVVFALLLVLWEWTDAARWYTDGLLAVAGVVGPALHGWVLETDTQAAARPVWVRGGERVQAALQFDALSVSLTLAVTLLAATPGLAWRRRAVLLAVGALLCFAVDVLIVVLFPLLVYYKNPFTDVIGTYLGLLAFVGAPVIIWFALTFHELQRLLPPLRPRR